MRIASQGGPINYSDRENHKRTRSDAPIEINSIEGDRSLDPDHEPRKEGTIMQLKQSPSVIEIGGMNDGMQSDPSNAGEGEKSFRNPQSRSPANRIHGSDDDPAQRSLNRDGKHTRSSRKIKPMYPIPNTHGSKQILKVVQEDNSSAHESN